MVKRALTSPPAPASEGRRWQRQDTFRCRTHCLLLPSFAVAAPCGHAAGLAALPLFLSSFSLALTPALVPVVVGRVPAQLV